MKIFTRFASAVAILLISSFTCYTANAETIAFNDEASITYETLVTDLTTGVEYHGKTGEPVIIETALGHQYSVITTAKVEGCSGPSSTVITRGHHMLGKDGLTINYCFLDANASFTHTYTFTLLENTELSYIENSIFSNATRIPLQSLWESATSSNGISTKMIDKRPVNDGYIIEVTTIKPEEDLNSVDRISRNIKIIRTILFVVGTIFIIGAVIYYKKKSACQS